MANPTISNNDIGSVILSDALFRDETYTAVAGAATVEGTILARLTSGGKIVVYEQGGSGGAEIPLGVLTYEVPDTTGDITIRMMVEGEVKKERLIIDVACGGGTVGNVEIDGLRDYGITALDVTERNIQDNQ